MNLFDRQQTQIQKINIFGVFVVAVIALSFTACGDSSSTQVDASKYANLTANQQIQASIDVAIGSKSNRDIPKVTSLDIQPAEDLFSGITVEDGLHDVVLRFAIDDNLGTRLVKLSARVEIADTLEQFTKDGAPVNMIRFEGTYPLVDGKGNSSEEVVVRAVYFESEYSQVNWDNFLHDNTYLLAETYSIHQAFQD